MHGGVIGVRFYCFFSIFLPQSVFLPEFNGFSPVFVCFFASGKVYFCIGAYFYPKKKNVHV